MFASSLGPRARRRGIVLVLILGMLGLVALIGVTFATFAGQSLKGSRDFMQGMARPSAEVLMDYAIAQLINDTSNPLSAIRGHSLLRDMYGNDSVFRGRDPSVSAAAATRGRLDRVYINGVANPLQILPGGGATPITGSINANTSSPFYNQVRVETNIPVGGQYYGLDFTRWIVTLPIPVPNASAIPQTFEILEDDTVTQATHIFTLSNNRGNPVVGVNVPYTSDDATFTYNNPNIIEVAPATRGRVVLSNIDLFINLTTPIRFTLSGEYMRAFNGPGLTRPDYGPDAVYPANFASYGNFRLSGLDPDAVGMDEDYDACDLENWFLAIQSADGQVIIPSFHRPGIIVADSATVSDWTVDYNDPTATPVVNQARRKRASKILRPRQRDNSPLFPADPIPNVTDGKITFDIDNDGDGVTDSVWLDLGYPVQRDPGGKLYKPLFAFMVLGLNGRLPLNTAGNLQARADGNALYDPTTFTQTYVGSDVSAATGNPPRPTTSYGDNPVGNAALDPSLPFRKTGTQVAVPYPGSYLPPMGAAKPFTAPSAIPPVQAYVSQTWTDAPLWDHASHLGYSVNEINPKYALQNAPNNVFPLTGGQRNDGLFPLGLVSYSQYDDAGMDVALTQLRNILAGTVPSKLPAPLPTTTPYPVSVANSQGNEDTNAVRVNGEFWILPNNVIDPSDAGYTNGAIARTSGAVAGRWGEVDGVPVAISLASVFGAPQSAYGIAEYTNPVRAGRSGFNSDIRDDDFDSVDPFFAFPGSTEASIDPYGSVAPQNGENYPGIIPATPATRQTPEGVDTFDRSGQMVFASERMRRFRTPVDPSATGRVVGYMNRPADRYDTGLGYDQRGRVGFFRYFRPAGMPQRINYPYAGDRYLKPQLSPAVASDTTTNRLAGFAQALLPGPLTIDAQAQNVAVMGAMPFDYRNDPAGTPVYVPDGYKPIAAAPSSYTAGLTLVAGTPSSPTLPQITKVNTDWGPNFNVAGGARPTYMAVGGPFGANNPASNLGVVNGYLAGSLNSDEADEMNLYTPNSFDQPFGPSDLEWLYRKHDVDGASLNSRLAKLAPVSFLNPADGLTRRRLFSVDSWELNSFVYANDNPSGYVHEQRAFAGTPQPPFQFNSRFSPRASASLYAMNQVAIDPTYLNSLGNTVTIGNYPGNLDYLGYTHANPIATWFIQNPTLPMNPNPSNPATNGTAINSYIATLGAGAVTLPMTVASQSTTSVFDTEPAANAMPMNYSALATSSVPVATPSLAHRDRRINLNFPLPISNDPAEPVRQKWVRETYLLLKSILPPQSVDTPEELAALSQYVVNIVDFRDPDCTATRFVNTDLEVKAPVPGTAGNPRGIPAGVQFAQSTNAPAQPFDPTLYQLDGVNPQTPFLVQHGMEASPVAINEALAYQTLYAPNQFNNRLYLELVNTLTKPYTEVAGTHNTEGDINLDGWDIVVTPDAYPWGRPNAVTGDVTNEALPLAKTVTGVPANNPPQPQTPRTTDNYQYMHGNIGLPGYIFANNSTLTPAAGATVTKSPRVHPIGNGGTAPHYFVLTNEMLTTGSKVGTGTGAAPAGSESASIRPINEALYGNEPGVPPPTGDTGDGTDTRAMGLFPDYAMPFGKSVVRSGADLNYDDRVALPLPGSATGDPDPGSGKYYWVYLRRPANPFDDAKLTNGKPNREMVVVDSMRFLFIEAGGTAGGAPTTGSNVIHSTERLQPHRGGHLLYSYGYGGIQPSNAYGYSEQTVPADTGSRPGYPTTDNHGQVPAGGATSLNIDSTLGKENSDHDAAWCHVPMHDRDFTSVAELLLVPGCPPGLFTKQFVEEPYPGNTGGSGYDDGHLPPSGNAPPTTISGTPNTRAQEKGRENFGMPAPPTGRIPTPSFPYLPDNFYYSAASIAPPVYDTTVPANVPFPREIGGRTGAGWHKMMDFFEVPSSANGATGPAGAGVDFDWYRSDVKPGLMNLNLVIDEEAFFGILDDDRLNRRLAAKYAALLYGGGTDLTNFLPSIVTQVDVNGYPSVLQPGAAAAATTFARYPISNANSLNNADPLSYSEVSNQVGRGYVFRDPTNSATLVHGMKAAFSDFLKNRHGGSGYLFAFGSGPPGSGTYLATNNAANQAFDILSTQGLDTTPVASERPYRSLSFPDINYTILRPASLPPSAYDRVTPRTALPSWSVPAIPVGLDNLHNYAPLAAAAPNAAEAFYVETSPNESPNNLTIPNGYQYVYDPGLKNPFLARQYYNTSPLPPLMPNANNQAIPPTPARRWFQIPDVDGVATGFTDRAYSNAGLFGAYTFADSAATNNRPRYAVNQPTSNLQMTTGNGSAAESTVTHGSGAGSTFTSPPTLVGVWGEQVLMPDNQTTDGRGRTPYLGSNTTINNDRDNRQHPLYRTEWLQKVMNLTTVRTHQYAVWITVGFFEVVTQGVPEFGVPDVLGGELNEAAGARVRYRSFFVLDRTQAKGFNPYYPGDFRDVITYRRRIE